MDNKIDNIVTYSNILAMTKAIVKKVGFEFQAPLDDATIDEIVSAEVMKVVGERIGGVKA